jgi:hypothetical protein
MKHLSAFYSGGWIFVSWRARIVVPDLLAAMGFAYPCPDSGQGDDSYHGWTGTRMVGIDPDPVVGQTPGPGPASISRLRKAFPSSSLLDKEKKDSFFQTLCHAVFRMKAEMSSGENSDGRYS